MAEGNEPSFGWLVIVRAWQGTLETFETTWRAIVLAIVLAIVSLGVQFGHSGKDAMMADVGTTIWQTLLPIAVVGGIILFWNLWLAPAALAFEAAQKALAAAQAPASASVPMAPPEPPINWAIWKHRSEYNMYEFAKILAKTEPADSTLSREAAAYLRLVREEVDNKRLKYIPRYAMGFESRYEVSVDEYSEIPRADALAWAKAKGFDVSVVE
jgi:hypothetical protein